MTMGPEDVSISTKIKDFAFAPHRYNSEAKTLLRLVLTFDATMTTAAQVILLRGASSEEQSANQLHCLGNLRAHAEPKHGLHQPHEKCEV